MIVISAGLPRSGTGWLYNLTNDLLVACGQLPAGEVRRRYHLSAVLKPHNCNVGRPGWLKLTALTVPHLRGRTFAVKTHRAVNAAVRAWVAMNMARATYIYRDPRDVVVSALEAGQKLRGYGKRNSFARLTTIDMAIAATQRWLRIWEGWINYAPALHVRYEDLAADPLAQARRLAEYLQLALDDDGLRRVVEMAAPDRQRVGAHFSKGVAGRFRQVLSPQQIELCQRTFGEYLKKMGYE